MRTKELCNFTTTSSHIEHIDALQDSKCTQTHIGVYWFSKDSCVADMSTPTEQASGSFNDLKPDILALIVSKCEPSMYDLCAWSTLSRRMKEVCYSPSMWRSIQIECRPKRNVYGWGLELLAPRAAGLEELTLTKINLPVSFRTWIFK